MALVLAASGGSSLAVVIAVVFLFVVVIVCYYRRPRESQQSSTLHEQASYPTEKPDSNAEPVYEEIKMATSRYVTKEELFMVDNNMAYHTLKQSYV